MTKQNKKRTALSLSLALAIFSAVMINMYYQNDSDIKSKAEATEKLGDSILVNSTVEDDDEISDVSKTQEYFAEAELKRTKAHDQALDEIQKLIENNGGDEKITSLLEDYTNKVKLETDIENLITAKIGTDCLCCINGDSAEVVVEAQAVDELYLLQISDIVAAQSGISPDKIVIISAK